MQWPAVQKRIREIWPKIAKHVPERMAAPRHKYEHPDELVFEAMCKMVWGDHPMRKPLGNPYPTVHPLYRRIAVLVQSRALDKLWAGYLKQLGKDTNGGCGGRPLRVSRRASGVGSASGRLGSRF